MPRYEYKVVPAPTKGLKAKGVKSPEARFALAVEELMNRLGAEGWEYLRADLLPSDERSGLTGSTVNWRNLLVFRRLKEGAAEAFQPRLIEAPDPTAPAPPLPGAPAAWPADPQEPPMHAEAEDEAEDEAAEEVDEAEDHNAKEAAEDKARG